MSVKFVADVGGTNIRLAQTQDGKLTDIKKYLCADFDTIADAIQHYFDEFTDRTFSAGCIAIACPVTSDWVKMTNHTWQFSTQELTQVLGLEYLAVINDFTSVAYSLTVLNDEQKVQIGTGESSPDGNIAVFGPGTGLGVEHLTQVENGWKTLDGEGGHVDFAPVDDTDLIIFKYIRNLHGRASAEEVMSGRGLLHIYQALAEHRGISPTIDEPAEVTLKALSGECEVCVDSLHQFCRIMGSFAGNLALNLATTGGVYIGGGIAPRFVDFLQSSDFRQRFESKGRFEHYVKPIPTYIITEPDHGLLGAAAYLEQHYAS
ncbi:glucokinase [Aestuariibacter salexigens]|uniref:glucokinase n=1 Tax=Aestuariibacter salexigens TaxID=226010 RepID=UPI000422A2FC|nr:glucokinase [Aestuariibacter salexigens]